MDEEKTIGQLVDDYLAGSLGSGPILFHKKMHRNGSGEFACLRGIIEQCPHVVNCQECYHTRKESFCLKDGQSVRGFLAVEEKHMSLVERGAEGAYDSVSEAVQSLA